MTHGIEIRRGGNRKFTICLGYGMDKSQHARMQHDPGDGRTLAGPDSYCPIDPIAQDWMADRLEMGPYLVRPAGLRTQQQAGSNRIECLLDMILRGRGLRLERARGSPFGVLSIRT